jgi:hypothetical protein
MEEVENWEAPIKPGTTHQQLQGRYRGQTSLTKPGAGLDSSPQFIAKRVETILDIALNEFS